MFSTAPQDALPSLASEVFDALPDGILMLSSDDDILAFNPAFARMWGAFCVPLIRSLSFTENLEAAAALGRSAGAAAAWLAHRHAANGDNGFLTLPDGTVLRISETAMSQGRRLVVCQDVTADHQREAALKDSEYRYRLLVETITEGLILLDREQRIVYANPRFLSWHGQNMDILGRPFTSLATETSRNRLEALFLSGDARSVEAALCCGPKVARFVLVSAAPLRSVDGAALGHFAIITDVTDLRRASERLRESEERLRGIFDNTPYGILTLNRQGTILTANPAFRTLLGLPLNRILGTNATAWLPDTMPQLDDMMVHLETPPHPRAISGKSRVRYAGDGLKHARLMLSQIGDGGDFLLSIEDVSEQRQMQDALRHASKLALLGEMSASLAHEISQPLNVIRLAAESALLVHADTELSPTNRSKFETIAEQSDRLRETIDYIQAFSRRDVGPRRCFNARDSLNTAITLLQPQCASLGIAVIISGTAAPLPVMGHGRQLEQVIINLLRNAIDAIIERRQKSEREDAIDIGVCIDDTVDDQAQIRIDIADTGTGIRTEDMPRLFDPFFTRKTEGSGTGLGLSISLGLISAMGGRITVDNLETGGCRFRVILPLCDQTISQVAIPQPTPAHQRLNGPLAILVVDDEVLATREITHYLENVGHTVYTAVSGLTARAQLANAHIDVLITDLRMPDGDGFDLISDVATEYPQIAIIAVTGQPLRDRDALSRVQNGADIVLHKPVSLHEIDSAIHQLCGQ